MQVEPSVQLLYDYIFSRGTIIPINDYNEDLLRHGDVAKQVSESIRLGTHEWEDLVPQAVQSQIKRLHLLGYRAHQGVTNGTGRSNGAQGSSTKARSTELPSRVGQASTAA